MLNIQGIYDLPFIQVFSIKWQNQSAIMRQMETTRTNWKLKGIVWKFQWKEVVWDLESLNEHSVDQLRDQSIDFQTIWVGVIDLGEGSVEMDLGRAAIK